MAGRAVKRWPWLLGVALLAGVLHGPVSGIVRGPLTLEAARPVSTAAQEPVYRTATGPAAGNTRPTGQTAGNTRATGPAAGDTRATVYLVTLGAFPGALADAVEKGIGDELQVTVRRADGTPLPKEAWYPPRKRYRADRLLEFLHERIPATPASNRALGLTGVDISTTKDAYPDWGVFGLGELSGRSCVISTFRLRRGARDDAQVRLRVVNVAIHEVGHTLGLPHCTEQGCVMQDAEGSIRNTDSSTGHLGPGCRARLEAEVPLKAGG